jgi:hypothetical protein
MSHPRANRLVGTTGFEPATSRSRTVRATKLRHVPMVPYVTAPEDVSRREAILAETAPLC